jgi:hypothetical protein
METVDEVSMTKLFLRRTLGVYALLAFLGVASVSPLQAQQNPSDNNLGSDSLLGPLPVVEPPRPVKSGCGIAERASGLKVTLIDQDFNDASGLQKWLNQRAVQKMRLVAIVPIRETESFFAFIPCRGNAPTHIVADVNGPLDSTDLENRLNAQPNRIFVGVHRFSQQSYAIVF